MVNQIEMWDGIPHGTMAELQEEVKHNEQWANIKAYCEKKPQLKADIREDFIDIHKYNITLREDGKVYFYGQDVFGKKTYTLKISLGEIRRLLEILAQFKEV